MNQLLIMVLLLLVPGLVLADNSLSFAPPASDYSMIFLGNLFGVVDGVLSGTGSQIMGSMFSVFNAAVLALGGIIIMYTLMVSTMNTAHEGQMLGQKWSSIWIPVRSTIGLALLIPKASGYCLMQIFVMWVVVQGVGAADKVWDAALSYLNRGGVIIQAQQVNPALALTTSNSGMSAIAKGAATILTGQICMLGLQTQLQNKRQSYLDAQQKGSGPCVSASPGSAMQTFCTTAVPDFIGTVNAVSVQTNTHNSNPSANSFSALMPAFDAGSPYASLNGLCGKIVWNSIDSLSSITNPGVGSNVSVGGINNISSTELSTAQMSRAIAIQQMYVDLSSVAQIIIGNDPQMSASNRDNEGSSQYSLVAKQQFGVPYTQNGTVCSNYSENCVIWGPASGSSGGGTLFNGTEFINAINDYSGVMMPTVNLLKQMKDTENANNTRAFIANASTQGWIMAGSYFFNLVKIQGSATDNSAQADNNTGLDGSIMANLSDIASQFQPCRSNLCTWFNGDLGPLNHLRSLIDGSPEVANPPLSPPDLSDNAQRKAIGGLASSTIYAFINNSVMVQAPGQPGIQPLTFANAIHFSVNQELYQMPEGHFDCGGVSIGFSRICLGSIFGNLFYNLIFRNIYNLFLAIFGEIIQQVIMAFLMIPLSGMAEIFKQGVSTLAQPGVNPVVALANMGVQYINFAGNLWMMLLNMAVTSALIPVFGIFIFALIALAMPLLIAWVGIMVSIGFTTAYYIPILPYMIFTFGAVSWLISVIEAMVAAPIVALGVTHPEGHDAFGKGEAAVMILVNVFLRPAMMIIGYIFAIALSYVGVWILNAGFDQAIAYIQQGNTGSFSSGFYQVMASIQQVSLGNNDGGTASGTGGYSDWAGIYAFFFSILTYTTIYLTLIQKSFTLISYLPDKILRWIGGNPESLGQESAQWGEEVKSSGKEAAKATQDAQGQMSKQLGGYAMKGLGKAKESIGQSRSGEVSGEAGAKPPPPSAA